ncbi:DUF5462 family protein [Citrobacter portucalensis]|uniref:DUF5462 family protein n=1 Tax=Citrobacter portucalensis TaxID=1639133 RepID=UPI00288909D1|nr:DUF5462 family protein [Citrobacter portucalensis]WNI84219.1 DUF5462 family protein [Citrobacter portucalensis]
MVLNNMKTVMAGVLMAALAGAGPVTASPDERVQRLGVVNGQVKDNQVVEVTRTLTDPVLYRTDAPAPVPQTLRIRNATARAGDNGAVWLTVRQVMPGTKPQDSTVTARASLWVDGKQTAAVFSQQGVDVLVSAADKAPPLRQVILRSDAPVVLQVPAGWRGPVEVLMDITGE